MFSSLRAREDLLLNLIMDAGEAIEQGGADPHADLATVGAWAQRRPAFPSALGDLARLVRVDGRPAKRSVCTLASRRREDRSRHFCPRFTPFEEPAHESLKASGLSGRA